MPGIKNPSALDFMGEDGRETSGSPRTRREEFEQPPSPRGYGGPGKVAKETKGKRREDTDIAALDEDHRYPKRLRKNEEKLLTGQLR